MLTVLKCRTTKAISYSQLKFGARFVCSSAPINSSAYRSEITNMKSYVDESKADEPHQLTMPFARAKLGPFYQQMPTLGNQFTEDVTLQKYLRRNIPAQMYSEIQPDLERFGQRVATDLLELSNEIDKSPPTLEQFDAWGKRVDKIHTCSAWKKMKCVSAEEGLIAIAYERKYEQWSRIYQMAKLYMFAPSSGLFMCPLAMTDGAAKSIEVIGAKGPLDKAYKNLTSRNPDKFWTSGQWMTERKGGSDVANGTQTMAVKQSDGTYKLYGYKWFSSSTDSDMSLTLARPCSENGQFIEGTKGLSMFFLEVRDDNGELNNIEVVRLKDKLGTKQVPTAELLLDGTKAFKVSEDGRGVPSIANMLTLTRIHNSLGAASGMRRMINLARDYSRKRNCFGNTIKDYPLHIRTLANMEIKARAALLFALDSARLLGLDDSDKISQKDKDIFRLLTPVLKLYTAKQAMSVASEGLECFGGMGYLEDTGLPKLLRDAQVLPIWEGTTNILSLDALRAIYKSQGRVLKSFHDEVLQRLEPIRKNSELGNSAEKIGKGVSQILEFARQHSDILETAAREFSFSIARCYAGLLLLEHANWHEATEEDVLAAQRWCQQELVPVMNPEKLGHYSPSTSKAELKLVFQGSPSSKL